MVESVLILDGQAVQTLIVAESLHKSGYRVVALCDGKDNYGYHCRFISEKYLGPSSHQIEVYNTFLIDFLKKHHVDVVIPMTDESAICASMMKGTILHYSRVLIPDYEVFMKGYDKNKLMTLCKESGYPHPQTIDLSAIDIDNSIEIEKFPYPALLKPNQTTGGRGMVKIKDKDNLQKVYPMIREQYGNCHLQQYIQHGGRQIKVQLFVDEEHQLRYSSVIHKQRYYPVNGGSSCCNVTIEEPVAINVCASVLKDIGWVGFADFDLIENPTTGRLLIMEINPRIPACVKSAFKSGVDYATIIADATLGKPLKDYTYVPGKHLRHLGFEILWFLKSPDRFRTKPNWFDFFGKNIYYQDLSWNEIPAFIYGTWGNLKKQMNPEFRKAKAGLET